MINRLIEWSLRNRFVVVCGLLFLIGWGIRALYRTPVDAIPDLSENQVIVFAEVVLILFAFLLLIVFHFSVVISKLTDRNKELTQRYSLLELEFNEFKKQLSSEPGRNPS